MEANIHLLPWRQSARKAKSRRFYKIDVSQKKVRVKNPIKIPKKLTVKRLTSHSTKQSYVESYKKSFHDLFYIVSSVFDEGIKSSNRREPDGMTYAIADLNRFTKVIKFKQKLCSSTMGRLLRRFSRLYLETLKLLRYRLIVSEWSYYRTNEFKVI